MAGPHSRVVKSLGLVYDASPPTSDVQPERWSGLLDVANIMVVVDQVHLFDTAWTVEQQDVFLVVVGQHVLDRYLLMIPK